MIIKNNYMNCFDCVKDEIVNGEHLTLTVSHRLDEENPHLSGWFVSITTHDYVTDETDWGFCYGWCKTYHEAITGLKNDVSYKRYPFPC